ncbi:MAG TPA: carboxypeptidase-like regulatory domain-containing protein [Thermoanaerobaculia bacterium]|nr:carboxypeptidase-like regulatory domain-containing protein [Thermoanaerobaculia bacterium]
MPLLLILMMLGAEAAPTVAPSASIDATIRGTTQPLEVQLLLRDDTGNWKGIARKSLPAETRRVRFDGLEAGVYQLLVRGPAATEQLATKIGVGRTDARRTTITIEPFVLSGRVTLGGTELGAGGLLLKHREFQSRSEIFLAPDGTFRVPFWQRGTFSYGVRGPALPTTYSNTAELEGASPGSLHIDIPDGRISGILRDAKSGQPVDAATVMLQTNIGDREEHVRLTTGPEGRFDFVGIKHGSHIVRIHAAQHLEPEPIAFELTDAAPLRELDLRLDPGRPVPIVVIDKEHDPVANAKVFVVADAKLRARGTTDEDGRASVPVPAGEAATLFVVPEEGPFAMMRVPRPDEKRRLQVYLPSSTSSLLIRAQTTDGGTMPPFSLLMRYNGELVPTEVAEELTEVQGLQLATGPDSQAHLRNIPSGSYEFWPYRSQAEAESIVAAGSTFLAPIQVNVLTGENKIAVKFASRRPGVP